MSCLKIYYQNTYVLSIFHVKLFKCRKFVVLQIIRLKDTIVALQRRMS